jgi:diketogulonate reductase-like aldo/keto reductase
MDITDITDIEFLGDNLLDLTKSTTRINVKRKRLSEEGQSIPLMGFGTYNINDPNVITNALKIGYRHFDLAHSYGNLEEVKAALQNALLPVEEGGLGIHRDEIWLTMKVMTLKFNIQSPEVYIRKLLASVGTDYFDLVLYHHPRDFFDSRESLIVAWITMTGLPETIVRRVGVSNFYIQHITRLLEICENCNLKKPFANEIQINPYIYQSERDLIHLCYSNGMALIAYSPLGYIGAEKLLGDPKLLDFARRIEVSTAQLVLSWLIAKNICVIPKSNSYQRQEENFKSCDISVASVAPFLSEIDNLSKEERVAYLAYSALGGKQSAEFLKW